MTSRIFVGNLVGARVITCGSDISVSSAAGLMRIGECSSIVLTDLGLPVGIFTECDTKKIDFADPSQLALPVSAFATMEVKSIRRDALVSEAVSRFRGENIRHLLVTDDEDELAGIISQTDAVLSAAVWQRLGTYVVADALTGPTLTIDGDLSLAEAVREMRREAADWAVIASADGRPIGLLTERDLVQLVATGFVARKVGEVARKPLLMVDGQYNLLKAWGLMVRAKLRHLVVLGQDGGVQGVLSFGALLDIAAKEADFHTDDQHLSEAERAEAMGCRFVPPSGPITRNIRKRPVGDDDAARVGSGVKPPGARILKRFRRSSMR